MLGCQHEHVYAKQWRDTEAPVYRGYSSTVLREGENADTHVPWRGKR